MSSTQDAPLETGPGLLVEGDNCIGGHARAFKVQAEGCGGALLLGSINQANANANADPNSNPNPDQDLDDGIDSMLAGGLSTAFFVRRDETRRAPKNATLVPGPPA